MALFRTVSQIIEPSTVIEGAGVLLRRSIAPSSANLYDPFLLFDHFAFNDPREGPIRGFPMHPHRGIETVTYMLEGNVHHRDSLGNAGLIGPGDVQWMTSGRGILHEEMPRRSPEGNIYGFQLWVNLPAARKMDTPRYQEVSSATIPMYRKDGVTVRVVAGEVEGVCGPVTEIAANPLYLDVRLEPGASFVQPVPPGYTVMAYVYQGEGEFGLNAAGTASRPSAPLDAAETASRPSAPLDAAETASRPSAPLDAAETASRPSAPLNAAGTGSIVEATRMLIFGDGDTLSVRSAPAAPVHFMLMAGAPFREPIVPYGPFVMNTVEEIQQALDDLRKGTFVQPV